MIEFSLSKPRAPLSQQKNTVKILGLRIIEMFRNLQNLFYSAISPQDPHWRSSEKTPQSPGPDHPCYARTKKIPAFLKALSRSTVLLLKKLCFAHFYPNVPVYLNNIQCTCKCCITMKSIDRRETSGSQLIS